MAQAAAAEVQAWQALADTADLEAEYLRELAGVERLEDATYIQLVVSTSGTSISHLGKALPNLQELHLNNSMLDSLRDLGTCFTRLQVLWVSRCGLRDFDGISVLPLLRELYAAYNDVTDLHPLGACPHLEVVDLEGNCVVDPSSAGYLSSCGSLQFLTLSGNPLADTTSYRQSVCSQLPSLRMLDDQPVEQHDRVLTPTHAASASRGNSMAHTSGQHHDQRSDQRQQPDQELAFLTHSIKHARVGLDSQEFKELEMSLLVATADGHAEVSMEGARPGTGSLLPASASTWMRTLRSSREGNLAALRASQQSPLVHGSSTSPQSLTPCSSSPSTSRPSSTTLHQHAQASTGAGASRRANSNPGGGDAPTSPMGLPPRPNSGGRPGTANPQRPFTGRPGTSSSTPRLGTSASAGAAVGANASAGLYWSKHRLGSAGSDGVPTPAVVTAAAAAEDAHVDASAGSALTFGSESSFGGSLAKDLRRWKGGQAGAGTLLGAANGRSNSTAASAAAMAAHGSGGGGGGGSGRLFRLNGDGQLEQGALLDELKKWKMDTADKVLADAEADAGSSSHDWMVGGSSSHDAAAPDILRIGNGSSRAESCSGANGADDQALTPEQQPSSPMLLPVRAPPGQAVRKMVLAKVVRDTTGASMSCKPSGEALLGSPQHTSGFGRSSADHVQQQQHHHHRPGSGSGQGSSVATPCAATSSHASASGTPRAISARPGTGPFACVPDHGCDPYSTMAGRSISSREDAAASNHQLRAAAAAAMAGGGSACNVLSVAGEVDVQSANPRPIRRADSEDEG